MKKDIGLLIKNISDSLKKLVDSFFGSMNLTFSQVQVLSFISNSKNKRTTQKEIEVFLGVSHPTVTGIIKRLEEKQFVKTNIYVDNGIKKSVELDTMGLEFEKESLTNQRAHEALLTKNLTAQEKKQLVVLLEKVQSSISVEIENTK
ncbi:MAG: MarR family transcriptional regulator [Treponema sp.]